MMRTLSSFVFVLCLVGAGIGAASAQSLRVHVAAQERVLAHAELKSLAEGGQSWMVYEPHEMRDRIYRGASVQLLLDAIYGDAWRQAGAVLFQCADGYRALVAVEKLIRYPAMLSWAAGDAEVFSLSNRLQGDEQVDLAPFYLVWDNHGHPELREEGASDWPYQVVAVGLVDAREHLAAAWPPQEAVRAVQRGFDAFRRHCVTCHAVNGAGGVKARDLIQPIPAGDMDGDALLRWLLDPQAIRPGTTMPSLPMDLAGRETVADEIIAYLRVMAEGSR